MKARDGIKWLSALLLACYLLSMRVWAAPSQLEAGTSNDMRGTGPVAASCSWALQGLHRHRGAAQELLPSKHEDRVNHGILPVWRGVSRHAGNVGVSGG